MRHQDFADFYASAFPRVSAAVRAFCGDADVAHEATQEAFARCFSRWRRLRGETWVEGWVITTAMNEARRHHRHRARLAHKAEEESSPPADAERLDLLAVLRALPERQREAVVLHHLMDVPVIGVAGLMKISEGAVKSHLHKARTALRRALEPSHG